MPKREGRRLSKTLTLLDVYVIALGPMLSSGFFLLPGLAAAKAGPSVPLAYLLAALLVMPAMLSKAELSTAMPRAGGTYYFLDRSMGPMFGTVGGLGTWLVLILKSAFALIGMGAYLVLFVELPIKPVAIALTLALALVTYLGSKVSSGVQRILVPAVLGMLFLLLSVGAVEVLIGDRHLLHERFTPFSPHGVGGLLSTVGFVFISYAGLTKVASLAEEVRDPDRSIPLGMFLALLTATVINVVGVTLMVAAIDPEALHGDLHPVATAGLSFLRRLPHGLALFLAAAPALAGVTAAGVAGVLSASRFPLAMARDKLVSSRFEGLSRFGTPTLGIVATAAGMILAILVLDVGSVAKLASAFQLLVFALVNLSLIVMRESGLESYDPGYRAPLYPWIQIVGLIVPFLLIAAMGTMPILFTSVLIGACLGWYFVYAHDRVERSGAVLHWFERLGRGRFEGLDAELRGILKEKGVRSEDPFGEVVGRAQEVDLPAGAGFAEAVRQASALLAERLGKDADRLAQGFLEGTQVGATPVAHGAALPHLQLEDADAPELVLMRSREGIDVEVGDQFPEHVPRDERIHALFFLVSPKSNPGQHLRLLAGIAGRVDDEDFMEAWLATERTADLSEVVLQDECFLSLTLGPGTASQWIGRPLRKLELPKGVLVALVHRAGIVVVPDGSTVLRAGDRLTVVGEGGGIRQLRARFAQPSSSSASI